MGYFGTKKNGSGYYDEPAYKAIVSCEPQKGDIWEDNLGNKCLIVNKKGGVCSILKLLSDNKPGTIPLNACSQMYANPQFLSYGFSYNMTKFIKVMPEREFAEITRAIYAAIGATVSAQENEAQKGRIAELEAQVVKLKQELKEKDCQMSDMKQKSLSDGVYKQLFEDLLSKVVEAKANG